MNRINKQNLSMFSKETLDSLEMAEVLGGDNNTNCSNTSCTNRCQNTDDCENTKCETNFNCSGNCVCDITTPINGRECVVTQCVCKKDI